MKTSNQKTAVRKLEYTKGISICLAVFLMLSTPFLVESKVETDKPYKLSLVATHIFSTITLTAHLTRTEDHKQKDVAGATIHFYSCNSKGHIIKELGKCTTKKDGTATFSWSATHNGDYWFVAEYVSNTNEKHDGHS